MKAVRRKYSIGRERSCDIPLADDSVSGHHAELEFLEDGKWLLTDCRSTNGTFLLGNGGAPRRLSQSLVSPLDQVRFGAVTLGMRELLEALRLKAGLKELEMGRPVSGEADPKEMSSLDRDLLKDSLTVVKRFKATLRQRFRLDAM